MGVGELLLNTGDKGRPIAREGGFGPPVEQVRVGDFSLGVVEWMAFRGSDIHPDPLGSGKADVWICRNLAVFSQDRTLQNAGCGDQQLVGWIAMERLRQLGGFHYDLRMEVHKRHARSRKGAFYPEPDCSIEL